MCFCPEFFAFTVRAFLEKKSAPPAVNDFQKGSMCEAYLQQITGDEVAPVLFQTPDFIPEILFERVEDDRLFRIVILPAGKSFCFYLRVQGWREKAGMRQKKD